MDQQVLQMWLWRRRIPECVSLHQHRFFHGARSGLHARYLSSESTAWLKSVSCRICFFFLRTDSRIVWAQTLNLETVLENDESSLSSLTQMIIIDYKLNSTVAFMVLLSECEHDRKENMHECIRLQIWRHRRDMLDWTSLEMTPTMQMEPWKASAAKIRNWQNREMHLDWEWEDSWDESGRLPTLRGAVRPEKEADNHHFGTACFNCAARNRALWLHNHRNL